MWLHLSRDRSQVLFPRKRTHKFCGFPLIRNVCFLLKCFLYRLKKNLPPRIPNVIRQLWPFIIMGFWELIGMWSHLFALDLGTIPWNCKTYKDSIVRQSHLSGICLQSSEQCSFSLEMDNITRDLFFKPRDYRNMKIPTYCLVLYLERMKSQYNV